MDPNNEKRRSVVGALRREGRAIVGLAGGCAALLLGGMLSSCSTPGGGEKPTAAATLNVAGMGWFRDRELRLSLERLLGSARGEVLRANAVEDALFLLMSAVQEEGFLQPTVTVECVDAGGAKTEFALDASMATAVPRTMAARAVSFRVKPGVRFFVSGVTFAGLHAVPERTARSFFVGDAGVFAGKASRAHTPARLARGLDGLEGPEFFGVGGEGLGRSVIGRS